MERIGKITIVVCSVVVGYVLFAPVIGSLMGFAAIVGITVYDEVKNPSLQQPVEQEKRKPIGFHQD